MRRISEDLLENERDMIEEANDEILSEQQDSHMRNENPNIEIIQVEQDATSSSIQLEDNKDSPYHEAEPSRRSDNAQLKPVQPPEQNLSDDMIRIDTMLLTFGLTQKQLRKNGINIEVLQYLPEQELVSVLSDIASNLPQEEAKDNEVSQRLSRQIKEALPYNQEFCMKKET